MSDNEDRELQALQRQLDDAFETTRPRAGFEDDLWSRMQARRPAWARVRDFVAGLFAVVRRVPAAPAATVAVVLVLAIGIGVLSLKGPGRGGGGSAGMSATSRDSGSAPLAGTASGAFGRLPAPALQPVSGAYTAPTAAGPDGTRAGQPVVGLYFGPAKLAWAGQFTIRLTSAPVYRYAEPTSADADKFATSLRASRQPVPAGAAGLGSYSGTDFVLGVVGTTPSPLREPSFFLTPDRSSLPAPWPTAMDTANAFLAAHNVMPAWPYVIAVMESADVERVLYLREFVVEGVGSQVYMVDGVGERHGLEVDLRGGQPLQAAGPLPVALDTAKYPIISAAQAVKSALASSPAGPASIEPIPTVRLTTVELVYALAIAGDHSFYEPAFLFSGSFTYNGVTYLKRVLVPAVGA